MTNKTQLLFTRKVWQNLVSLRKTTTFFVLKVWNNQLNQPPYLNFVTFYFFSINQRQSNKNTTDWLTGWPADWLAGCLTDWLVGWLAACLVACLTAWLTDWLTDWPTDRLTDWLTDWQTDWLTDYPPLGMDVLRRRLFVWKYLHNISFQYRNYFDKCAWYGVCLLTYLL